MQGCPHCQAAPQKPLALDREHELAIAGAAVARLAPTEFALVDALLHTKGRPAYHDWLVETVWPAGGTANALACAVRRTRRALKRIGWDIEATRKGAYMLKPTAPQGVERQALACEIPAHAPPAPPPPPSWAQRLPGAQAVLARLEGRA